MMRACIFAFAAIIPAFAIDRVGAADEPPAFDIAKNCREEVVGSIETAGSCTKDETDAKNELSNAGLNLALRRRNRASAKPTSAAIRAMSSF
jgi:hypothetical protein